MIGKSTKTWHFNCIKLCCLIWQIMLKMTLKKSSVFVLWKNESWHTYSKIVCISSWSSSSHNFTKHATSTTTSAQWAGRWTGGWTNQIVSRGCLWDWHAQWKYGPRKIQLDQNLTVINADIFGVNVQAFSLFYIHCSSLTPGDVRLFPLTECLCLMEIHQAPDRMQEQHSK